MSRFLTYSLAIVLAVTGLAHAHELADGAIERRVQISVKPDGVLVQYSLAMNDATLDQELKRLKLSPAATLSEKWAQYQKAILASLPKQMQATLNGKRISLKPVRADVSGFSHRNLTCLLKADIQLSSKPKSIVITDGNFLDTPGEYRIAMKARSGAIMEKSTAPLLTSRAKPIALTKLTKQQKQTAVRVTGTIALK